MGVRQIDELRLTLRAKTAIFRARELRRGSAAVTLSGYY